MFSEGLLIGNVIFTAISGKMPFLGHIADKFQRPIIFLVDLAIKVGWSVPSKSVKRWNFCKTKWSHYIALTNKFNRNCLNSNSLLSESSDALQERLKSRRPLVPATRNLFLTILPDLAYALLIRHYIGKTRSTARIHPDSLLSNP